MIGDQLTSLEAHPFTAELWAISEALGIASKTANIGSTPITIFCNSQKALKAIALPFTCQKNRFLRSLIYQDNGHSITFRWIPSHSGLIGNEKADLAAKNRAEKGGRLTERWSSLAYIRRNVTEMRSKDTAKWHETETQNRETSRRGYYIPRTKEGISLILGNAPNVMSWHVIRSRDLVHATRESNDTRKLQHASTELA